MRVKHQHRFDLYEDEKGEMRLEEYLKKLGSKSVASDWMRKSLIAVMTAEQMAIDPRTVAHAMLTDKHELIGAATKTVYIGDNVQYVEPENIP